MGIIESAVASDAVDEWAHTADVVVVGLGMAGVCAALEAHRAGAKVLVIERASGGGGASATSEGILYLGGGTALQRDLGFEDSPDNMFAFMRSSTSTTDDAKLRQFCDDSPAHFDWLEAQGVPFERKAFTGKAVALRTGEGLLMTGNEKVWPHRDDAAPVPRGHQTRASMTESGGAAAMKSLLATYATEHIETFYDTAVVALVTDGDGGVRGVKVRSLGEERFVQARRGVIITAGSFNLSEDLTRRNIPVVAEHGRPLGLDTNDGSGVLLGESVGVRTEGMDGVIATASIYPPAQLIKGIVVNTLGKRFVAEDVYHGRLAWNIERQPGQRAYLIVDEEIFAYPERGHPLVDGWETVEEMERGLGMPEGSLVATVEAYNRSASTGEDEEFHKYHDWVRPLGPGPYAAFDLSFDKRLYSYITLGGLATNVNGQAVDEAGHPVRGLYAAGASAAHFPQTGAEYASGMSLGPGSYFGRRAGRHAATGDGSIC